MGLEKYLKRFQERTHQEAKLLSARPEFQAAIKKLRQELGIPNKGLKSEEVGPWHDKLYQADERYFAEEGPKLRKKVRDLRSEKKVREAEQAIEEFNNNSPFNHYKISVRRLMMELRIPASWTVGVEHYLLRNLQSGLVREALRIRKLVGDETSPDELSIVIEKDTTREDIIDLWAFIESAQRRLPQRAQQKYQPIPKLDQSLRALALRHEGYTYKEIAEKLTVEFGEEVGWTEIGTILRNIRNRLGIN
jgi:hypothetical protein